MAYRLNFFTGRLDYYEDNYFRGVLSVEPTTPIDGWTYINSSDNGYYIYYGGSWQLLHTLTAAAASFLLQEDNFFILQEDSSSKFIQE